MISINLVTKSNIKILYLFSEVPGKSLSRKEILKLTKLANNPLDNSLKYLVNSKILVKERKKYKLNFENEFVEVINNLFKKERAKLRNLSYTIWLILFEFITKLLNKIDVKEIYLFGSYAKLVYNEKSDLDICVVVEKRMPEIDFKIEKIVSSIEKKFDKKLQIHLFEEKEFKKRSKIVREISEDGIKLV